MKLLVFVLLLLAFGLSFFAYREHHEVERQNEVLRTKDLETAELRLRIEGLAKRPKNVVDQNETRLAQVEKPAFGKQSSEKLAAEQQWVLLENRLSGLRESLKKETDQLAALRQRREALVGNSGGGTVTALDKRIQQEGEDLRSYEERVKNYRASYQQQSGTQKQSLSRLRSNYQVEYARLTQLMNIQAGAIRSFDAEQVSLRRRKIDSDRPRKLQELAEQLASQNQRLTNLKNQMAATKSAEQLDIQYLQNQIWVSDISANQAKNEITTLKLEKEKLAQEKTASAREMRQLSDEIKAQEARVKQMQLQLEFESQLNSR